VRKLDIHAQTCAMRADGERLTCVPATVVPTAQRRMPL
jgi:urease alpha subunit